MTKTMKSDARRLPFTMIGNFKEKQEEKLKTISFRFY